MQYLLVMFSSYLWNLQQFPPLSLLNAIQMYIYIFDECIIIFKSNETIVLISLLNSLYGGLNFVNPITTISKTLFSKKKKKNDWLWPEKSKSLQIFRKLWNTFRIMLWWWWRCQKVFLYVQIQMYTFRLCWHFENIIQDTHNNNTIIWMQLFKIFWLSSVIIIPLARNDRSLFLSLFLVW